MATAIIADERLMREQLRARLTEVWPDLQILAEAKNGEKPSRRSANIGLTLHSSTSGCRE
jgi:DNA-binding LytR/AlgR family response regulator